MSFVDEWIFTKTVCYEEIVFALMSEVICG